MALAFLVCSFVAQSEVAQYVQQALDFNKPFMVTWINHAAMGLLVPVFWRSGMKHRLEVEFAMPLRKILVLMSVLSLLYTLGDYAWYLALPYTSVAEATALFNSQSVFAYAFSVLLLGERLLALKVVAVLVALGGICVISAFAAKGDVHAENATFAPSPPPPSSTLDLRGSRLIGDCFAVGAAAAYAAYEVLYKRGLGESGSEDTALVNIATG